MHEISVFKEVAVEDFDFPCCYIFSGGRERHRHHERPVARWQKYPDELGHSQTTRT